MRCGPAIGSFAAEMLPRQGEILVNSENTSLMALRAKIGVKRGKKSGYRMQCISCLKSHFNAARDRARCHHREIATRPRQKFAPVITRLHLT